MYKNHTKCRACGSERLVPAFNLGIQPLANDFVGEGDEQAGYAPLDVLFCESCSLAQLSVTVDPKLLYRHYVYVTSDSKAMADHFTRLVNDIETMNGTGSVLEIGSNDGKLLSYFKGRGFGPVIGIDPAENLSTLASARGIETLTSEFSRASAQHAQGVLGKVDVILARHVFCHVDDWHEFLVSAESISHDGTLIALEVPYVADLLDKVEFDTIYHEHTSYLSIAAIEAALRGTGLALCKVQPYSIHGGAVLLLIRKTPSGAPLGDPTPITIDHWRSFAVEADRKIHNLKKLVGGLVHEGKTVAGYGASAKSTVWIQACGFTDRHISCIFDNTPQKIGKLSPGSSIPIADEKDLLTLMPNYCVLFAWNFKDDVIAKNQDYLKAGGHFIVPSPELEIV